MKHKDDINSFIESVMEEYSDLNEDFLDDLVDKPRRFVDNKTGLLVYCNKTVTDYFRLDIDPKRKSHHRIVKTEWYHKLRHRISGNKPKYITNLNKSLLKQKEDALEDLVSKEKIIEIDNRTKKIYNLIQPRMPQQKHTKKKHTKYNTSILQDYEMGQDTKRIMLRISKNEYSSNEGKKHIIEKFSRYFSDVKGELLSSIPWISLECEAKNIERIKKELRIISDKEEFGSIDSDEEGVLVYLPELVMPKRDIIECSRSRWNLSMIGTEEAHSITKGKESTIAIIDTGVDYNHDELKERFDRSNLGYDFIRGGRDPMDLNSHGTHVGGIVAGTSIGVAPEAQLYALRVLNKDGIGDSFNVMRAIEWGMKMKVDVINLSLGSRSYMKSMQDMCLAAHSRGICIVAAAGNDSNHSYNYPAAYEGVISVPAVDRNKKHAYFSNINDMNDISAPGVDIYSSIPGNGYANYNGTSMATPHISGVCSLAKALTKGVSRRIEKDMKETALNLGERNIFGYGLVKAEKLLEVYT